MSHETIFFSYVGAAAFVAALALMFGSHKKVYGAAALLSILLVSNIVLGLRRAGFLQLEALLSLFAALDALVAILFARFYSPRAIQKNRWAAFAAGAQFCMCVANLSAIFVPALRQSSDLFIALNVLSVAVMAACFIAFTPKDLQEAKQVLAIKLFYIRNDLFGLRALMNRKSETSKIDGHIGERMRVARILKNMTRDQLGLALNVSGQQIEKYEKAINRISASTLHDASKALGVDVSFFFEGIDGAMAGTILPFPELGKLRGKS